MREVSNIVSRPRGVTIIALLVFLAAAILALGACVFLIAGIAGMIGTDSGEPLSVAIAAAIRCWCCQGLRRSWRSAF
jgi:hypothetical protein